jgi:hypothetical protein
VGIDIPKIEVRFENLSIEGDAYVGTRALPTLLNSTLNSIEVFCSVSLSASDSISFSSSSSSSSSILWKCLVRMIPWPVIHNYRIKYQLCQKENSYRFSETEI